MVQLNCLGNGLVHYSYISRCSQVVVYVRNDGMTTQLCMYGDVSMAPGTEVRQTKNVYCG
jgi:hypothetical protein